MREAHPRYEHPEAGTEKALRSYLEVRLTDSRAIMRLCNVSTKKACGSCKRTVATQAIRLLRLAFASFASITSSR